MKSSTKRARLALIGSAVTCLLLMQAGPASALPMDDAKKLPGAAAGTQSVPSSAPLQAPDASLSPMLSAELQRGNWRKACSIAADALARSEQNVDALGVFGICAALRSDQTAANTALQRLRDAESPPYYATLTEGILQLRNGAAEKADATFASVLKSRPADPLALYFAGEAQHQPSATRRRSHLSRRC